MSGAVFLSYASQDAEAARRICEALRGAGVEVWFDESELRGGDSWDANIRKQIRECGLFIPVISVHTQARREGYFRLEWKLADDRTHLMAKGTPFLLPVCVDTTKDWDAIVPDSFTAVQWTRLPDGMTPPAFGDRVKALLVPGSMTETRLPGPTKGGEGGDAAASAKPPARRRLWLGTGVVCLAIVGALGFWRPWHRTGGEPSSAIPALPGPADQLLAQAREQMDKVNTTPDNATVAEDLCRQAVELAPTSAKAWALRAYVQSYYILRTWDGSAKRRLDVQTYANRALALDPDQPEAMFALSLVLWFQGANPEAEAMLRRAIALDPNDSRLRRRLASVLQTEGRSREAMAEGLEAARRFPKDPLVYYDLALLYLNSNNRTDAEEALKCLNTTLALEYFPSAILNKALILAGARGDFAGAQQTMDKLNPADRTTDRAVSFAMWLGLLQHNPDQVEAAAALTARPYFEDAYFRGPKSMMQALAYHMAGKEALANREWQEAESVVREHVKQNPANASDQLQLAISLAWQGRGQEAKREVEEGEARATEGSSNFLFWYLAKYYAGTGDAAHAAACLRKCLNDREIYTDETLMSDPWWDKLRGKPEFEALLAEAKERIARRKP